MPKYITIKLTDQQVAKSMQALSWALDPNMPASYSANAFTQRLINKYRKELNKVGLDFEPHA